MDKSTPLIITHAHQDDLDKPTSLTCGNDSSIDIRDGDVVEIPVDIREVKWMTREGVNLTLEFADGISLILNQFFLRDNLAYVGVLVFSHTILTNEQLSYLMDGSGLDQLTPDNLASMHALSHYHAIFHPDGSIGGITDMGIVEHIPFIYWIEFSELFSKAVSPKFFINNKDINNVSWVKCQRIKHNNFLVSGLPTSRQLGDFDFRVEL